MFKLFKKKQQPKKDLFEKDDFNIDHTIDFKEPRSFAVAVRYANDFVDTIYPACAACYNVSKNKNTTRDERLAYIEKRIKAGHTSILEHSNVVLQAFIPMNKNTVSIEDIDEYYHHTITSVDIGESTESIFTMVENVTDYCHYLNKKTDYIYDRENNEYLRITLGGSIRGYRWLYENIDDRGNQLFNTIFRALQLAVPCEFFADYIEDGMMQPYFIDTGDISIKKELLNGKTNDYIDIINMDSLDEISSLLRLPKENCFDFVTISTDFKNMSRIITQQLTRHRNAITQESQRYVNYSDKGFNLPTEFTDKYDVDKVYDTNLGKYTLKELSELLCSVYPDLVGQGLKKEDARAYLPQNIKCGNLFMTFTLRTLFSFINLRSSTHAQAEIRCYEQVLESLTKQYMYDLKETSMHDAAWYYTLPKYKRGESPLYKENVEEEA